MLREKCTLKSIAQKFQTFSADYSLMILMEIALLTSCRKL